MRAAPMRPMGAHRGNLRLVADSEKDRLATDNCGNVKSGIPIDPVAAAIIAVWYVLGITAWVVALWWVIS